MPLKAGHYTVTFNLRTTSQAVVGDVVRVDVLGSNGREIVVRNLSQSDIEKSNGVVSLEFSLLELEFGIQARCISFGNAAVECDLPIRFKPSAAA